MAKDLRAAAAWREAHDPAASPADWRFHAFLSLFNVGSGRAREEMTPATARQVAEALSEAEVQRQAMADAATQHDVTQCQSGAKLGTDAR